MNPPTSEGKAQMSKVDMSNSGRGIWLVKVPKYLAARWQKIPGNLEAAKLRITKTSPGQRPKVTLTLSEATLCLKEPDEQDIPKEHDLIVAPVSQQTLGVFSYNQESTDDLKISVEGKIQQKLECRPHADNKYMMLKQEEIKKAAQPERQVVRLSGVVNSYKPIANHKHNIEYDERKKNEGKKSRDDKDKVLEMLFGAFEDHQYYNLKDLVRITNQPVTYLKEVLKEILPYSYIMSSNSNKNVSFKFSLHGDKLTEYGGHTAGSNELNLAIGNNAEDESTSSSGTSSEGSTSSESIVTRGTPLATKSLKADKTVRFTGTEFTIRGSNFSVPSKTKGKVFCDWFFQRVAKIFAFPFLAGERICFHREDLEPLDTRSLKAAWESKKDVEDLVNFDSVAIKNMYANILEQRKQVQCSKDKYHFAKVDLTPYPRWDANIINRLRATFQIFDISGDGVIDFEEFSNVLSEFGDKTSPEIRLKYFSKAKTDEFGTIGFEDFLMILYELTEKEIDSPVDQSLVDTFKKIEDNMTHKGTEFELQMQDFAHVV
ncbi:unnamed protein product [Allacma fusca]|uniref:General transcription factor IIF subunit 2 n=1 Tax=Allacma fusca TaxID=39272 RepID=A0A8J2PFK8_9HEXA|nr:unnamed protein product [Allacma fusca]